MKANIKAAALAVSVCLFCAYVPSAMASVIYWTLQDVTFDDGGTAYGTFETDATTGLLVDWNITTTQGTGPFGALFGFQYTPSTSNDTDFFQSDTYIELSTLLPIVNPPPYDALQLIFANSLTSAGDDPLYVVPSVPTSVEFQSLPGCMPVESCYRLAISGYAASVPANVPAPDTLSLLGLGLAGFWLVRRRNGQMLSV